ncbi:MAG: hypothetical protein JRH20_24740, partial [Deltaproteobacteria bacterium]|nr:hypothetical protein [Deltaproteobacteria bacterium]
PAQRTLRPRSQSVLGAMPPHLEKLKADVMKERWPAGTALEFAANHVFAVHRKPVLEKVRELLRETHTWRNQRIATRVDFARLSAKHLDGFSDAHLSPKTTTKLRRTGLTRPTAFLLTRGGSRNELFVAEMHSVLAGAWTANHSSPPMHVYFKGVRLAALPRLGPNVGRAVSLYVKRFELAHTLPQRVVGAVLQQPKDGAWTHERELHLPEKGALLTGLRRDGDKATTGLLVATQSSSQ